MISSFSLLTRAELESLHPEMTVFLFPLGGAEQHGRHLPMGLKFYQAEHLTKQLAERLSEKLPQWNFILMPLLPFSVDTVTNAYSVSVRPHVVRDAIVDQCEQLKRLRFLKFIAVSAHLTPKQLCAIEDAARIVSKKSAQLVSLSSLWVEPKQVWNSPWVPLPEEHGAAFDYSSAKTLVPKFLNESAKEFESIPKPAANADRFFKFIRGEIDGQWGVKGEDFDNAYTKWCQTELPLVAEKLIPWLERREGKKQFLSPYRFFPVHGSFFKAYLLAILFFISMMLFVLAGVQDVLTP